MTDSLDEGRPAMTRGATDDVMLLLAGRRVARWMRVWRVRPRPRGCRIVVIGPAEALGDVENCVTSGAIVVCVDVEALAHELTATAGVLTGRSAGAEVFDQVIERIAGEVYTADLVVLAAATAGPAELAAAGAIDGFGGSLSPEVDAPGAAAARLTAAWQMPAEGDWVPRGIALPEVAERLVGTQQAALSAPVAVMAGAARRAD